MENGLIESVKAVILFVLGIFAGIELQKQIVD